MCFALGSRVRGRDCGGYVGYQKVGAHTSRATRHDGIDFRSCGRASASVPELLEQIEPEAI